MAKKRKPKLSPIASKIAGLVNELADGNNSKFARLVGCTRPVISRVVRGEQEPGANLLKRIGAIKGVDSKELFELAQDKIRTADWTYIPIAMCLLPGKPNTNPSLLTNKSVEVPAGIYTSSLYALPASECDSNFDSLEGLQPSDLIVFETEVKSFKENLRGLSGKMCAIAEKGKGAKALTLQRVSCQMNSSKRWHLSVDNTPKEPNRRLVDIHGTEGANEDDSGDETSGQPSVSSEKIDLSQVRGFAVISIRYL